MTTKEQPLKVYEQEPMKSIIAHIETATVEHCAGADLWMSSYLAATKIAKLYDARVQELEATLVVARGTLALLQGYGPLDVGPAAWAESGGDEAIAAIDANIKGGV